MRKPFRHITVQDRRVIFNMIREQKPIDEVAEKPGFHRSTINREIGRNRIVPERDNRPYQYYLHHRTEGYYPVSAHGVAQVLRQKQRKLVQRPRLLRHVVAKLKASWSPQQIAGRLALDPHPCGHISHETIDPYAYSDQGRADGIACLLPKARKKRRPRFSRKPRQSFIPDSHRIQARPESVENREEFGHWEGDLMIFRRENGKSNISTIIERQTRYTILIKNQDRRSQPLIEQIQLSMQDMPGQARKTITFDRGTEFASDGLLNENLGMKACFCDPHSPWQKGGAENTNGRARRFLPGEMNRSTLPNRFFQNPRRQAQQHATKMPGLPKAK